MALIEHWEDSLFCQELPRHQGWESCRRAWEILHYPIDEDPTSFSQLDTRLLSLTCLEGTMAAEIWHSLPLTGHVLKVPSKGEKNAVCQALGHLSTAHPVLALQCVEFLRVIGFVTREQPPEAISVSAASGLLTSVSVPDLPFCSFFSSRAALHIPPHIQVPRPDIHFLAENLYHESVHQKVTLTLLEKEWLKPGYHTLTSPRVAVPWRTHAASSAMRLWEIDRVLHAWIVYLSLLHYRHTQACLFPHSAWGEYFNQARECAIFLGKALRDNHTLFTPLGHAAPRGYRPASCPFFPNKVF